MRIGREGRSSPSSFLQPQSDKQAFPKDNGFFEQKKFIRWKSIEQSLKFTDVHIHLKHMKRIFISVSDLPLSEFNSYPRYTHTYVYELLT